MKRKLAPLLVFGLLVLGVGALGWTFVKRPLHVPDTPITPLPDPPKVRRLSLSIVPGAEMSSLEGFSVRGGSLGQDFTHGLAAFLVQHPRGKLLIDAGVAREVHAHLETTPWLMRMVASLALKQATIDALAAGGIAPKKLQGILLTHAHWDHVSGLADFANQVPVWLTAEELEYAWQDEQGGKLLRELQVQARLKIQKLELTDGAYGPFPWSKDWFGDGSVVVVPMGGHTPGSIGVFVNLPSGKRFLFIGDTAWTREGVEWPAEKPWLARRMVDDSPALVRDELVFLHKLAKRHPELMIVPAHDARVHAQMTIFPDKER